MGDWSVRRSAVELIELGEHGRRLGAREKLRGRLARRLADERAQLLSADAPATAGRLDGTQLTGRDPVGGWRGLRPHVWTVGAIGKGLKVEGAAEQART